MRKILAGVFAWLLFAGAAFAQTGFGQIPAYTILGNQTTSSAAPTFNATPRLGNTATWPLSSYSFNMAAAVFGITDPGGVGALALASRSSDWTNVLANNNITLSVLCANDKTTLGPTGSWCNYWQGVKTAGAANIPMYLVEASLQNLGPSVITDPFTVNPSHFTAAIRADSGIGTSTGNPVSAAIQIIPNGNTFNAGLQIGAGSLASGSNAIQLPTNYDISWFSAASTVVGQIAYDNTGTLQASGAGGINLSGPVKFSGAAGAANAMLVSAGSGAVDTWISSCGFCIIGTAAGGLPGFTATPTLGVNGSYGGSLTLNGLTSGATSISALAAGNLTFSGSSPVPSSCGGTPSITGNDYDGIINTGTGATTTCTVTLSVGFTNNLFCVASPIGAANNGLFVNLTSPKIFVLNYTSATAQKFTYHCAGN